MGSTGSQHAWLLLLILLFLWPACIACLQGHRLKNMNCKLIRELKTLHTENKLLLTGEWATGWAVKCCPEQAAVLLVGCM
jgi:hypothetical protein